MAAGVPVMAHPDEQTHLAERLESVLKAGDQAVGEFDPGPTRRVGVLVDHLVNGSKEARIAASVRHPDVLVRGHRFIDVWAAINPSLVGLRAWPDVPRDRPWKDGICAALGVAEPPQFWRQLLGKVRTYADLDPTLVGAVEELIDFVTEVDDDAG